MFSRLAHIAFRVRDLDASLAFFCDGLGFREAFRLNHPETGKLWIVYVQVSQYQFIELFPVGEELEPGNQYHHLCLQSDDLHATVAELRRRGVTIVREISQGPTGNLKAWVRDPDGNDIELMQIHPDSPQGRATSSWPGLA